MVDRSLTLAQAAFNVDFLDPHGSFEQLRAHYHDCLAKYSDNPSHFLAPYFAECNSSGWGKSKELSRLALEEKGLYVCINRPSSVCVPAPDVSAHACFSRRYGSFQEAVLHFVDVLFYIHHHVRHEHESSLAWDQLGTIGREYKEPLARARSRVSGTPLSPSSSPPSCTPDNDSVLLVLDEAAWMTKEPCANMDHAPSVFRAIRRAARESWSVGVRVFIIVAGTLSSLSNFSPPAPADPSLKQVPESQQLLPPYFSLNYVDLPCPRSWSVLRRLLVLGRPVWHANRSLTLAELLELAASKLICKPIPQDLTDIVSTLPPAAHLAVLSSRLSLEVHPLSPLAADMTAFYMATCIGVSEDRSSVTVTYGCEPILSEAAAHIMAHPRNYSRLLKTLLGQIKASTIVLNRGALGELVARLGVMRAYDLSMRAQPRSSFRELEPLSSPPVPSTGPSSSQQETSSSSSAAASSSSSSASSTSTSFEEQMIHFSLEAARGQDPSLRNAFSRMSLVRARRLPFLPCRALSFNNVCSSSAIFLHQMSWVFL